MLGLGKGCGGSDLGQMEGGKRAEWRKDRPRGGGFNPSEAESYAPSQARNPNMGLVKTASAKQMQHLRSPIEKDGYLLGVKEQKFSTGYSNGHLAPTASVQIGLGVNFLYFWT